MSSEGSIKRNIVRRSSLEIANRDFLPAANKEYTDLTQEDTIIGTPPTVQYGEKYPASRVHFVPSTVKSTLGSPTALAIGAFSTTLTTLSLSLMEWRGVTTTNVYIGNCGYRNLIQSVVTYARTSVENPYFYFYLSL
jgi:hypothetical protein